MIRRKKHILLAALLFDCLLFAVANLFGQGKQEIIQGLLKGTDGLALPGASVSIKGSSRSVITDDFGHYSIAAAIGETIVFTSVGYKRLEHVITSAESVNMVLVPSYSNLEEVIMTGYTSQKVKDITGSVASVKPRDLVAIPAGQVEQMLQGRVAGLSVISTGEPGGAVNIRLRGIGNFGDVTPLYIIDGVPGDINSLNPYDIESLQVLKDAGAYSIYGVRGANGVIVVTTRKGRSGRARISYDFRVWQTEPLQSPKRLSPQENANLLWLAKRNSGQVDSLGNPSDALYGNGPNPVLPDYLYAGPNRTALFEGDPLVADSLYNLDPDKGPLYQIVRFNKSGTDWFHELYKPALSQEHDVNVSGGSDKNQYLFSMGYLDQQGTLLNTYLKRFTGRVNTQFQVMNNFRIGENLQISYTDNPQSSKLVNGGGRSDAGEAIGFNPAAPVYDIRGNFTGGVNHVNGGSPEDNPVARRTFAKDNKSKTWRILGNAFAELDFLKYFSARSSFGGNYTNFYNYSFSRASFAYPQAGGPNTLNESSGYLSSWIWTNTVSFSKIFYKYHSLKLLAGGEMINNFNREMGGSAQNLAFTDPNYWLLTNGDGLTKTNYSIASISKLQSYISRLEYGFKDRYLLTVNLRHDGSSVFGPKNRYGWFPSVGLAWLPTEEKFLRESRWLTHMKLRFSYGKTGFYGNTDPANQFTLYGGGPADAFYDINGNNSGSIQRGFRVVRLGNPKTGWQQDEQFNAGLDLELWKGKLSINADWYQKNSQGLLFPVALPDILGDVIPPNVNVGNIRNSGIDLTVGSRGSLNKNWQWDVLGTFTHYNNKILKLNDLPFFEDFFGGVRNQVGNPMSMFWGYKVLGYFKDSGDVAKSPYQDGAAPGRFKYADVGSLDSLGRVQSVPDGKISDADRVFVGNPHPKFTMGLNLGLRFRSFDFSTFFFGSFGNDVFNVTNSLNVYTG